MKRVFACVIFVCAQLTAGWAEAVAILDAKRAAIARGPSGSVAGKPPQIDWLIQSERRCFGIAPTCIAVGSPFLKRISVGIERTP